MVAAYISTKIRKQFGKNAAGYGTFDY